MARERFNAYLKTEQSLRIRGTAEEEIRAGRAAQARAISEARKAARDLPPSERADFVRRALRQGELRTTAGEVPPEALAQLDYLQNVIDRAYPDRQFDWLTATNALRDAVDSGALEPRQREILQAVIGDRMPDVERVTAAVGRMKAEATTMPLDLGPELTKPGQPPLIGETGGAYLPEGQYANLQEEYRAWREGIERERQALLSRRGEAYGGQGPVLGAHRPVTETQAPLLETEGLFPQRGAFLESGSAEDRTAAWQEYLDSVRGRSENPRYNPQGGAMATAGPEMRPIVDPGAPGNLVLRGQTVADAELGVVPIPGERKSVAYARRAAQSETFRERASATIADVINLPRAFKTGFDMSATLRQALPLGAAHPVAFGRAFRAQVRAMASPKAYDEIITGIQQAPFAELRKKAGLFLGHASDEVIGPREEAFLSRLAGKIPVLRGSERGYVAMLDKLRADVFDSTIESWLKQGISPAEQNVKDLADFINHATGRGTGEFLDRIGNKAALAFFAPRYAVSRPQLVADLVMKGGPVRKEVAKSLVAWLGGVGTLAALAGVALDAETEINPLSGGFAKTRIGRQSFDLTGGLGIDLRTLAQVISGKRADARGNLVEVNRLGTIGRFTRGKLSPTAALAIDALSGKDYQGYEIDWQRLTGPGSGGAELFNTFGNLFLQEVAEAGKEAFGEGVSGRKLLQVAAVAAAAFLGAGVQTDTSPYTDREDWSLATFGKPWDELPSAQRALLPPGIRNAIAASFEGRNPDAAAESRERDARLAEADRVYEEGITLAFDRLDKARASGDPATERRGIEDFKDALDKLQNDRRAKRGEHEFPESANLTPLDRAVNAWYGIYDQPGVRDPLTGKVDRERVEELQLGLLSLWDSETQRYVMGRVMGGRNMTVEEAQELAQGAAPDRLTQYYDDLRKIAETGVYDAPSWTRFRLEHPEADDLMRKWNVSPATARAVDAHRVHEAEQAASDRKLEMQGPSYAPAWREEYQDRQRALGIKLDAAFADSTVRPPRDANEALLQEYYAFYDSLADPSTGKIRKGGVDAAGEYQPGGYDQLDEWLAGRPDVQAALDAREPKPVSPAVQRYREDVATILEAHYWDVQDEMAKRWTAYEGWPVELGSYDELEAYVRANIYPRAQAQLPDNPEAAHALTEQVVAQVLKPVRDISAKVRAAMRTDDALLRALVRQGYYNPGKEATRALLGGSP